MSKEEIAKQIGAHLEKYFASNSVRLPKNVFEIKQFAEVVIDEDSISEYGDLTKFKGNATIIISDATTNVSTTCKKREIEGTAIITEVQNLLKQNLPEVKSLTITTINL